MVQQKVEYFNRFPHGLHLHAYPKTQTIDSSFVRRQIAILYKNKYDIFSYHTCHSDVLKSTASVLHRACRSVAAPPPCRKMNLLYTAYKTCSEPQLVLLQRRDDIATEDQANGKISNPQAKEVISRDVPIPKFWPMPIRHFKTIRIHLVTNLCSYLIMP